MKLYKYPDFETIVFNDFYKWNEKKKKVKHDEKKIWKIKLTSVSLIFFHIEKI